MQAKDEKMGRNGLEGVYYSVTKLMGGISDGRFSFFGALLRKETGDGGCGGHLRLMPRKEGYKEIRLGWVKGNPQAEHFWHKNGFTETGRTCDTEQYKVIVARRAL